MQHPAQVGQHLGLRDSDPLPLLVVHILWHFLGVKPVQVLTALGVPFIDSRVDLDLIKHLLGLVGKLLGGTVFLRQFQQHMGLVFLQVSLGQHQHLFIDVLRLPHRVKSMAEGLRKLQYITAGLPVLGLTFLLPQLEFCGERLHTQIGKGVVRQAHLPQKAETALHFPDHRLVRKIIGQERPGDDQRQDTQGFQQFRRLVTVVQLGQDLTVLPGPPTEIERGVAHHIVKTNLRLVGSDVARDDIGGGKQVSGHLAGFGVDLTSVEV